MRLLRNAVRWLQILRRLVRACSPFGATAATHRGALLILIALGCGGPQRSVAQQPDAQVNPQSSDAQPSDSQSPDTSSLPTAQIEYWMGALQIGDLKLNLRLDVQSNEKQTRSGKLISIDQGNAEIPLDSVSLANGKLEFDCQKIQAHYAGTLNEAGDTAAGTFEQFGNKFDLELRRVEDPMALMPERPQMPKPPFTYVSQDVTFENAAAGITLAGTLTVPAKGSNFPAVVLVTGSGPQDRDETLLQHKPFLVIADHLSRHGIAVLRYDDRGVGQSGGDFATSTTQDFAQDAAAAIGFLAARDDIDPGRIGLIGHSEGGNIATMLAASDRRLAHVIMLAGPGVPGSEVVISQAQAIADKSGQVDPHAQLRKQVIELVRRDAPREEIERVLDGFFGPANEGSATSETPITAASDADTNENQPAQTDSTAEQQTNRMLRMAFRQMDSPWFRVFLKYDPRVDLRRTTCPVLALNGSLDLQILPDVNLPEIEKALAESTVEGHRCEKLDKLNHLFQESETGLPQEYGKLTQTISPAVLNMITEWIQRH